MAEFIVQRLSMYVDRARNMLWFSGEMTDGHKWAVGFPLAHIVMTFDAQMSDQGMASSAVMGDNEIVSLDGFFGSIAKAVSGAAKGVAHAASSAYKGTVRKVGQQAIKYGTQAVKIASAPMTSAIRATSDIAHGKNVLQTAKRFAQSNVTSAASNLRMGGNFVSFIPGIGTGAAFAVQFTASVADAAARGKNVFDASKKAAINAALNSLPGGELTGSLVRTAVNVARAGVQGQNILRSTRNELVASAISLVPNPQLQQALRGAADAAIAGRNVLQGAAGGALQAALAQVSDPSARSMLMATLRGANPSSIVVRANANLLAHAAASAPTGGAATFVTAAAGANPSQIVAASRVVR